MRNLYRIPLFFTSLVLVSGCRNNPFAPPWDHAPNGSNMVWEPDIKELDVVKRLQLDTMLEIPAPEDMVALGELFDIALKNSPDTAKTWQAAREAAANFSSSLSPYLPSLSFDGSFEVVKQGYIFDNTFVLNKMIGYGPEVLVQYLLWDSGATKANADLYYQTLQGLNWIHNETIQGVMKKTAMAYYDHLYAKALLAAYEADLANAKASFDAAEIKFSSGLYDQTEMLQMKTVYLQRKVLYTGQAKNVQNSFVSLLSQIGIPCNIAFQVGEFPKTPLFSPSLESEEELMLLAQNNRPELLSAKANILSQEANLKKAKADLMPKVHLGGQGGVQWFSRGFTDNGNYLLRVDLTFPIFTGFYHVNQVRKAESEIQKAVAIMREKELTVMSEVKMAHNNLVSAKAELQDTKEYLDAAEIEYQAFFRKYTEGVASILDLLNALSFLSDARAKFARTEKEYYMSVINVSFATGMLLNTPS